MSNLNKILISVVLLIVVGSMFAYSSLGTKRAYGSSLLSSLDGLISSQDEVIQNDISFISTLASLNTIKIDTEFFSSPLFLNLKDNRVVIQKVESGRVNPFAPIGTN